MCATCLPDAHGVRKVIEFPGTEVSNCCKLPCGFGKLNLGPLQERQVFLHAEPSCPLSVFNTNMGIITEVVELKQKQKSIGLGSEKVALVWLDFFFFLRQNLIGSQYIS